MKRIDATKGIVFSAIMVLGLPSCLDFREPYFENCALGTQCEPYDGPTVLALESAPNATCGFLQGGEVLCWGSGRNGIFGNGYEFTNNRPEKINDLSGSIKQLKMSVRHSCAVLENGEVSCWGYGARGDTGRSEYLLLPFTVQNIEADSIESLALSHKQSCALVDEGKVVCWGKSQFNWTSLGEDGVAIAAGSEHICVLSKDSNIKCVGDNDVGQLGPFEAHRSSDQEPPPFLDSARDITAYGRSTCAINANGRAYCWGAIGNYGITFTDRTMPQKLDFGDKIKKLAMGKEHICALLESGAVECLGDNSRGQLGDGTTSSRAYGASVVGLELAVDVSTGDQHTCAILEYGGVKCWGNNDLGQIGIGIGLGNSSKADRLRPVPIKSPKEGWPRLSHEEVASQDMSDMSMAPDDMRDMGMRDMTPTCSDDGQRMCGNTCVDTHTDSQNCGACGMVCQAQGSSCEQGTCVCTDGSRDCGGLCGFDLLSDAANCGQCGNVCVEGATCEQGTCVTPPAGMMLVPAGPFFMGSESGEDDEKPVHEVHVSGFFIDMHEVTVSQYDECVRAGGCSTPQKTHQVNASYNYGSSGREAHPINGVDWHQAVAYCQWAGKRLPTEAEWEKAARGTDEREYPWGNEAPSCRYAVMDDGRDGCGENQTWKVGSKPDGKSPHGIHDMAGNVREWVSDRYSTNYEAVPGSNQVVRGGGWDDASNNLRASNRFASLPSASSNTLGFRCVVSLN